MFLFGFFLGVALVGAAYHFAVFAKIKAEIAILKADFESFKAKL